MSYMELSAWFTKARQSDQKQITCTYQNLVIFVSNDMNQMIGNEKNHTCNLKLYGFIYFFENKYF